MTTRTSASAGRRRSGGWPPGRPAGHPDVHQDHVRAQFAGPARPPRSPSAASPTTSMSASPSRMEPEPGPDQRLVVGEQDPDHAVLLGLRAAAGSGAHPEAAVRRAGPPSSVPPSARGPLPHARRIPLPPPARRPVPAAASVVVDPHHGRHRRRGRTRTTTRAVAPGVPGRRWSAPPGRSGTPPGRPRGGSGRRRRPRSSGPSSPAGAACVDQFVEPVEPGRGCARGRLAGLAQRAEGRAHLAQRLLAGRLDRARAPARPAPGSVVQQVQRRHRPAR